MRKTFIAVLILLICSPLCFARVITRDVEYKHDDALLQGYLAYDDSIQAKTPAVLVFHEWWGLNDYAKKRAGQIADLGYVAFCPDMYGKGVIAKTPEQAGALAEKFRNDPVLMRSRAKAALDALKQFEFVNMQRIVAIGYCFGGGAALELARSGANILGTAIFHGTLSTKQPAKNDDIKGKVLILHGAADRATPPEVLAAFQKEMDEALVDWQVNIYANAVHGFTNPDNGEDITTGVAYNYRADMRSWKALKIFLEEVFDYK